MMSKSDSIQLDFGERENTNDWDIQSAMVLCASNKSFRRDFTSCSDHTNVRPPPIHRLPTELLLEIFLWGVTMESVSGGHSVKTIVTSTLKYNAFKSPHCALWLSGVCRLWRSVTTSCPQLWSCDEWCIDLDDTLPSDNGLFSHYLKMSKPLPLNLHLCCSFHDEPCSKTLRVVLSHRARFRSLRINHGYKIPKSMEKVLIESFGPRPITGYFPNLESFELESSNCVVLMQSQFVHTTNIFSVTPKLRSFVIDNDQFGGSAFPYSQLESFTLGNFDLDTDWRKLSRICPRLKKLILHHGSWFYHVPETLPSPVVFHSLTCVVFALNNFNSSRRMDALAIVWKTFVMPSLQSLCIYSKTGYKMDSDSLVFQDLKEFFSQLSCPLRKLRFVWVEISVPDLHQILRLVPQLTELTILFPLHDGATFPSCSYSGLIELLTKDDDDTRIPLLPCLAYLELEMKVDVDMMKRIAAMLDKDWPGELRLHTRGTQDRPVFIPRQLNAKFGLNLPKHVVGEFKETFVN